MTKFQIPESIAAEELRVTIHLPSVDGQVIQHGRNLDSPDWTNEDGVRGYQFFDQQPSDEYTFELSNSSEGFEVEADIEEVVEYQPGVRHISNATHIGDTDYITLIVRNEDVIEFNFDIDYQLERLWFETRADDEEICEQHLFLKWDSSFHYKPNSAVNHLQVYKADNIRVWGTNERKILHQVPVIREDMRE